MRVFKDQHSADLPSQMQSNLAILSGLQSQLQAEQDNLDRAKQQTVYLSVLDQSISRVARDPKAVRTALQWEAWRQSIRNWTD